MQELGLICISQVLLCKSQVLLCKSQVRHAKARFCTAVLLYSSNVNGLSTLWWLSILIQVAIHYFFNAFCANCAGPEQCFTMFRPRQWFIDPWVVIHPYLSRNTLLFFNAFCATFAAPHTVGCYACLFVSIASLMSSI